MKVYAHPFYVCLLWYHPQCHEEQRLRVLTELGLHEQEVRVCRFDKEWVAFILSVG